MIGLREAAGDAIFDVRARDGIDPIAHGVTQCSRLSVGCFEDAEIALAQSGQLMMPFTNISATSSGRWSGSMTTPPARSSCFLSLLNFAFTGTSLPPRFPRNSRRSKFSTLRGESGPRLVRARTVDRRHFSAGDAGVHRE